MSRKYLNQKNEKSQSSCSKCKSFRSVLNELTKAVECRNVEVVSHILNCSYDLRSAKQGEARTLIHKAFSKTNDKLELQPQIIQILNLLLDKGVDVNAKDSKDRTILHLAIEDRMTKVIDFLLHRQADLNVCDKLGNSLLHFLIKVESRKTSGRYHLFDSLLSLQTHQKHSANFIEWMIPKGLDVDVQNIDGNTPLHLAAVYNLLHALPILLTHAKDVKICNKEGKDAFLIFVEPSKVETKETRDRSDLGNSDVSETYEILTAAYNPTFFDRIFTMFLTKIFPPNFDDGIPVPYAMRERELNSRDFHGKTILHVAAQLAKSSGDIVRTLIKQGALLDVMDNNGYLPLDIAIIHHNLHAVKVLLNFGANINDTAHVLSDFLIIFEMKSMLSIKFSPRINLAHNKLPLDTLFLITNHLIKLQVAKLPIDDKFKCLLPSDSTQNPDIYEKCSSEVKSLKDYKIADCTSLYDLLHFNRNSTCAYVNNENLKELINSLTYKKQFPMYHVLISAAYHAGVERRKMNDSAKDALALLANIRWPEVCSHEIFRFLNNASLRSMIEAVKNSEDSELRATS